MKLSDYGVKGIECHAEVTGGKSLNEAARAICADVVHEADNGCDWLSKRVASALRGDNGFVIDIEFPTQSEITERVVAEALKSEAEDRIHTQYRDWTNEREGLMVTF